jgi:hypothetical protein
MTLTQGLLPVLVFVVTVGNAGPVALAARLFAGSEAGSFAEALRVAQLEAGLVYLVGVGVVWTVAGDGFDLSLWEIPATLLVTGLAAALVLAALPLAVGRRLVRSRCDVDSATALRAATLGWPVAMLVVFGIFVAPGGLSSGHLLSLTGARTCLAGFCGTSVLLAGTLALEFVVAVFLPGLVGTLIVARGPSGRESRSDRGA